MIDYTKKVTTRDGKEVRIFTTEGRHKDYPVVGEVLINGNWVVRTWTKEGKYWFHDEKSDYDLINPPEERWINVYPVGFECRLYPSKDKADKAARLGRIACIKFTEGEGL